MFDGTPFEKAELPNTGQDQFAASSRTDGRPKEFSAPTVSEAIDLACAELGIDRSNLIYEIRDSGLLNMLGFDSTLATIVVHNGPGREVTGAPPDDAVREQPSISEDLPSDLAPHVLEEAARRFDMAFSLVRQRYRSGGLLYDPLVGKLVEAPSQQAVTSESQRTDLHADEPRMLPRGYWAETDEMILRLKRGERRLLWRIVERLEPIVQAVVRKVKEGGNPLGLEDDDLLQIGRIEITGLLGSYDPRSETKIYVYMRQWLYHRILRVADETLPIRIPANLAPGSDLERRAAFFRSPRAYEQLEEVPENAFVGEEEGFEEMMREDLYRRVVRSAPLSERQLYVLEHRYGLNGKDEKTLEQVGEVLEVTRERVRQLQKEAIRIIKVHVHHSFGLNTGLDFSSGRWCTPKVFPAVVRGDFSLGEPPHAQPSISAVQEWAGPMLPHKKPSKTSARSKLTQPVGTKHSSSRGESNRPIYERRRATAPISPTPTSGRKKPRLTALRKLHPPAFEQVVSESFRADDHVGLEWYIRNASSNFRNAVARAARSDDLRHFMDIQDSELKPLLDNVAVIGVMCVKHGKPSLLAEVCRALHEIYETIHTSDPGRLPIWIRQAWMREVLMQRVYAIGASLLHRGSYEEVPLFIRQRITSDPRQSRFWARHALAMRLKEVPLSRYNLCSLAEHFVQGNTLFYEEFDGDKENISAAVVQFDFLQCVHEIYETQAFNACYPSFGVHRRDRVEPLLVRILRDGSGRAVLLPPLRDDELARIVRYLDSFAEREFPSPDRWGGSQWQDPKLRAFLRLR